MRKISVTMSVELSEEELQAGLKSMVKDVDNPGSEIKSVIVIDDETKEVLLNKTRKK